jgi:MFS transporter, PAT family, beta-lactamase induction signal transducer AmpG
MAALLGLGFASGLPLMLTGRTLRFWARSRDVDLAQVGLLSLVTLPYTFKFLWAPLMDRFAPPLLGRRRGWLLVTQLALMLCIAALGLYGPRTGHDSLRLFALLAVAVAFISASQDVVADAYRTEVLSDAELGAGASSFIGGYRLAMLATLPGAVFLAGHLPWRTVYLAAAAAMSLGAVVTWFAPEPVNGARRATTLAAAVVDPIADFLRRNGRRALWVALFIVLFKLPDYMAFAMADQLLQDLHFSNDQISLGSMWLGLAAVIPGAMVAGPIVVRLGLVRSLLVIGLAQALSNGAYLTLSLVGHNLHVMLAAVAIENFCNGMVTTAYIAFLMGQCNRRYSVTQYALLSSLMGLSGTLGGSGAGYLVKAIGYPRFFAVTMLVGLPAMLLLPIFRQRRAEELGTDSAVSSGSRQ